MLTSLILFSFLSVSAFAQLDYFNKDGSFFIQKEGKIIKCNSTLDSFECLSAWWSFSSTSLSVYDTERMKMSMTIISQEREIGRLTGQGSGDYLCPTSYNNIKVEKCSGFKYRVAFQLWGFNDNFQGYTLLKNTCYEMAKGTFYQPVTGGRMCRESITGSGQPGEWGTDNNGNFPVNFNVDEIATFQGGGDIIYYENLILCQDGSYNYRSSCPVAQLPTVSPVNDSQTYNPPVITQPPSNGGGITPLTTTAPDFFADPLGWLGFELSNLWNGFWKAILT